MKAYIILVYPKRWNPFSWAIAFRSLLEAKFGGEGKIPMISHVEFNITGKTYSYLWNGLTNKPSPNAYRYKVKLNLNETQMLQLKFDLERDLNIDMTYNLLGALRRLFGIRRKGLKRTNKNCMFCSEHAAKTLSKYGYDFHIPFEDIPPYKFLFLNNYKK